MMNKKAVSPLIATVLLIAFTVALGAIVMNWGESFVRKTQDTASSASEGKIECTMEVDFEVVNALYLEDDVTDENATLSLLIRNAGDAKISEFVAQVFTNTTKGARQIYDLSSLDSLDVKEIKFDFDLSNFTDGLVSNTSEIVEIKVIPKIDTGAISGPVSCSNKYETIGKDKLVVREE